MGKNVEQVSTANAVDIPVSNLDLEKALSAIDPEFKRIKLALPSADLSKAQARLDQAWDTYQRAQPDETVLGHLRVTRGIAYGIVKDEVNRLLTEATDLSQTSGATDTWQMIQKARSLINRDSLTALSTIRQAMSIFEQRKRRSEHVASLRSAGQPKSRKVRS